VLTIFAGLAQLGRDTIVERTTAGRNARGKLDGERGDRVPMGYVRTMDDKGNTDGVAVDEETAPIIRNIFWWREHDNTLREIADRLNDQGIMTPRGRRWHASSVKAVLGNEDKYRGGRPGTSSVQWPAILN
jgi:site-specific DNA recombinase